MPFDSPPVACDVENDGFVQLADLGAGGAEVVGADVAGLVGAALWLWVGFAAGERDADGVGVGVGFRLLAGLASGESEGVMLRPAGPPPPCVILATGSPVVVE